MTILLEENTLDTMNDLTVTLGSTSKTNGFVFSYFFAEKFKVCLEVSFFEYYHPKSHN